MSQYQHKALLIAMLLLFAAPVLAQDTDGDGIDDGSVDSLEIADGAVNTADLADDAVNSDKIAANAVGSSEIAASAVGSSEIAVNAVTSEHIAAGAVGSSEIADGSINTIDVANMAITEAKIADGAVTYDKLGADVHSRFDNIDKGLREANSGVAMAMAMANIPQLSLTNKRYSVGLGMGHYNGRTAYSAGIAARLKKSAVVQLSIGSSSEGETGAGAGVAWQW